MTEQTSTTATAADTPTEETTEQPATNREAKYRRQLRATETERDDLRTRIEALQRSDAERMSGLDKGAALWAAGTTLDDLTDDDGNLDPEKVRTASETARETLGAAVTSGTPKPDLSQGGHGGEAMGGDAFTEAFAPGR